MNTRLPQDQAAVTSSRPALGERVAAIYPTCHRLRQGDTWDRIVEVCAKDPRLETFPEKVSVQRDEFGLPDYFAELARLEWAIHQTTNSETVIPSEVDQYTLNPTLKLLELGWKGLPRLINDPREDGQHPAPGEEIVLIWLHPEGREAKVTAASEEDLLVVKIVVEKITAQAAAAQGGVPEAAVDAAVHRAISKGLILGPSSRIRRKTEGIPAPHPSLSAFHSARIFTLQWHITQACDLHCKHCYDRSDRSPVSLDRGLYVLDELVNFCKDGHVKGQVSFTGGNPLLHPHFFDLYQAAVDRGLVVALLGNPTSRKKLERMCDIQRPAFYQVSLEGLQPHNDDIRGMGHFDRVMEFLGLLKDMNIPSKVMLTLTQGNVDQVLPLGEKLRGVTDDFTFNRLSMVGEGANLRLPSLNRFASFLKDYVKASKQNPVMGWKDNFINILCRQNDVAPFGGCTGYGCGAAFNFVSLLSDGEVHACRKFPSAIGNIFEQSLVDIYDSQTAQAYRYGPQECRSCPIYLVCRGCLAVAYSHGLNVFEQRDPYCFIDTP